MVCPYEKLSKWHMAVMKSKKQDFAFPVYKLNTLYLSGDEGVNKNWINQACIEIELEIITGFCRFLKRH